MQQPLGVNKFRDALRNFPVSLPSEKGNDDCNYAEEYSDAPNCNRGLRGLSPPQLCRFDCMHQTVVARLLPLSEK